ncbi:arylsulfatase [Microbacterium awajiense]|uniref:Arylsulfatase n=1 Tax=Microbacterium awajiense TaxID=415214 RepID=A0ABP7AL59_9MICO
MASAPDGGQQRRPNIVLILADDMGWGDLGCYGASAIPTPRMDGLARGGVRFDDAHSSSSVCTPSRYSIMTGRYAWRSPLKQHVLHSHAPAIIEPERPTIASELHDAGYATGVFGKWHLGLDWQRKDGTRITAFGPDAEPDILDHPEQYPADEIDYGTPFTGGPCDLGFDRFFGIAGSLNMPPSAFLSQDRVVGEPTLQRPVYQPGINPGLMTEGWRDDEADVRFTEEAVTWMRDRAENGEPFFLFLSTAAPHRPCVPPAQFQGMSQAGPRGDAVCLVDWMVGRIDDTLAELGLADDTIVIVTSDNGAPTLYPEDGDTEHHRPNGPFRGQKGDIWDGGHREPLIMRWPAGLPAGVVRDDLICLTDLYPTILSAAGLVPREGAAEDAVDIIERLRQPSPTPRGRPVVHHSMGGAFGLRFERYKVNFCTESGGGFTARVTGDDGAVFGSDAPVGRIYDLEEDAIEAVDLWEELPDLAAQAHAALCDIVAGSRSGFACDIEPVGAVGQ